MTRDFLLLVVKVSTKEYSEPPQKTQKPANDHGIPKYPCLTPLQSQHGAFVVTCIRNDGRVSYVLCVGLRLRILVVPSSVLTEDVLCIHTANDRDVDIFCIVWCPRQELDCQWNDLRFGLGADSG